MDMQSFSSPLADRMRPKTLGDFVGQQAIIGEGRLLTRLIEQDAVPSMLFWGPPGSGKTTLAKIIAASTKAEFKQLSAMDSGVKDIRALIEEAQMLGRLGTRTILFIDEIHRWTKAQQDSLLSHIEKGTITFIGATTENPSFEVNSALLSRCRVFVLEMHSPQELTRIVARALTDATEGLGELNATLKPDALETLVYSSNGDARTALNVLELAVQAATPTKKGVRTITKEQIKEALQRTNVLFDKGGEEFYNLISALHKSMRGGDANAALYWLGRMLEGGADPLYVARRLVRFASEDIGMANSLALPQAVAAYDATHFIGMPECAVNLAQAVVYMAKSKKSNELYGGYQKVQQAIHETPNLPVPLHLRNAPTKLMKEIGYGKGYKYTPNYETPEDANQHYLPKDLLDKNFI